MLLGHLQTTPSIYLAKLLEVLLGLGFSREQVIRDTGATALDFQDRDGRVPLKRYLGIVSAASRMSRRPDLGFLVGQHTSAMEHGILGYALLSSSNLAQAMERYQRYQSLQGPLLQVEMTVDGDRATLSARPIRRSLRLGPQEITYFVQEWLGGWNEWTALLNHRGPFFEQVQLAETVRGHTRLYQHYLGCKVYSSCELTLASFPARLLDSTLDFNNHTVGAMCAAQCEFLHARVTSARGLTARIHSALLRTPGQIPSMNDMAERLHVSPRTLRRHLLREQITYQQLVIDFRMALAQQYLEATDLPVNEIAGLVGYADTANFYRTFRGTQGVTPQRYRDKLSLKSA